ncbi:MAG TPA: M50 family peptidase [Candidatus Nanopusillus sp.]|nr:M50 family peptidase [Candidatus Nanopusillus sp.]HIP90392.1 M50 family peptidase [Candidatus Nanopusillus sp.]
MVFYFFEIINIIVTVLVVGLIFSRSFDQKEITLWMKIAGLSIILHELAHKFVAISMGYYAIYEVSITGLLIGLFFRLIESPIVLFIPGYVRIIGDTTPLSLSAIAIAGPLTNLLLYFLGKILYQKNGKDCYYFLSYLNLWLFILNMLPVPPLDGFKFLYGMYKLLF